MISLYYTIVILYLQWNHTLYRLYYYNMHTVVFVSLVIFNTVFLFREYQWTMLSENVNTHSHKFRILCIIVLRINSLHKCEMCVNPRPQKCPTSNFPTGESFQLFLNKNYKCDLQYILSQHDWSSAKLWMHINHHMKLVLQLHTPVRGRDKKNKTTVE